MTSHTKVDLTKLTNEGLLIRTKSICREFDELQVRLDVIREELKECREEARTRTSNLYREVLDAWQEGEENLLPTWKQNLLVVADGFPLPSRPPSDGMRWSKQCGSRGEYMWIEVKDK